MAVVNFDPGYNKTLTILNGQTESDTVNLEGLGARRTMVHTIMSPATLPEITNILIANSPTGAFVIVQDNVMNVDLTAGDAQTLPAMSVSALKLVASGAVAADRIFQLQSAPY